MDRGVPRRSSCGGVRRWGDPFLPPTLHPLDLDAASRHSGVTVAGASPAARPSRLVTAPSGVWACLLGSAPTLLVGDLSTPLGRLRWSAPVRVPREALVTLHPFDDGRVLVAVFCPSRQRATLFGFSPEGDTATVLEVESRGPAVPLSPELALHQRDDRTVACTTLAGVTERCVRLDGDDVGVGRVCGRGPARFFVPWHAETVIDLVAGGAHPRQLGDDDAALRRALRTRLRRAQALATPAGVCLELQRAEAVPRRRKLLVQWEATPGDGALGGVLAAGWLQSPQGGAAPEPVDGWAPLEQGGMTLDVPHARWDEAEVDAALGALESAGLPLEASLGLLGSGFAWEAGDDIPVRRAFTADGARRFLAAWVCAQREGDGRAVRSTSRAMAPTMDVDAVVRVVGAARARSPEEARVLLECLAMLSVQVFGGDASSVVAALCRAPWARPVGYDARLPVVLRWLRGVMSDPGALSAVVVPAAAGSQALSFLVRKGME